MGVKIPREIRLEVIRKWLEGKSRDLIAHQVNIGAGTVSGIIKEFRSGDFDADLLREVALQLKNGGLDIQSFAPLVRLRHVLKEEMEWMSVFKVGQGGGKEESEGGSNVDFDQSVEKKMESLIMSLEVFCFKANLPVKQFFDCIHSIYLTAEKLDVPLEDISDYIKEQETHIKDLKESVKYWEAEAEAEFEKYHTTQESLKEFDMSRPMFDACQQLKQKLEQANKERDKYKCELESERFWNKHKEEQRWSILESELDNVNKDLYHKTGSYTGKMIDPKYLKGMVMDVYHNPSKYTDIISKLMERYDSEQHKRKEEKPTKAS